MTRDEALAEAQRRQRAYPEAKWLATREGDGWTVARINLAPVTVEPTATATTPPPTAPRDDPYSPLENVTRMFGGLG
jgi:hypothetical protein